MIELTLKHYLIICPLIFLGGFVDSIAGGGGLITVTAYLLAGLPAHFATATNKLSSSLGTLTSTAYYAKQGYIPVRISVYCVIVTLIGASLGAKIALSISDEYFKIIMLFILPFVAFTVLKNKALDVERPAYSESKTIAISLPIAFAIGMYDGFYGPGTGTFLLLLLTSLAHMTLQKAQGVTKVINLTSGLSSLVVFLLNGKVLIPLGLCAGAFSIAGNYLGSKMFGKKGAKIAAPIMIAVVALFFIKILSELF